MEQKNLKIIELKAENIKKLVAVSIKPDGNIVELNGANGQGKTSVLDAIAWALEGVKSIQGEPIRKGADRAWIELDLGDIVVKRTFKAGTDGASGTTTLKVESKDGASYKSPQAMLDDLIGRLAFDPLAFARMNPKAQFDELKRLVPGVDFDKIEALNRTDFEKRTELNRQAKSARASAERINATASAAVDETAIFEKVRAASDHNAGIENRKLRREQAAKEIESLAANIKTELAEIESMKRTVAGMEERKAELQKKLDMAEALPEPISIDAIQEELRKAKITNAEVAEFKKKGELISQAEALESGAQELTAKMEEREKSKRAAIEQAKLPVPGLGFGDGVVTLNGVPFDQASDAEQLRVSIALAMSMNPKLRVIRVRDGSLLDERSMKLLSEMARDQDYQVWIERVGSGKVGFELQDGHVKALVAA